MMLTHAIGLSIIATCGLLVGLGIVRIVAWNHSRAIERERVQLRMWHAIAAQAERGR